MPLDEGYFSTKVSMGVTSPQEWLENIPECQELERSILEFVEPYLQSKQVIFSRNIDSCS